MERIKSGSPVIWLDNKKYYKGIIVKRDGTRWIIKSGTFKPFSVHKENVVHEKDFDPELKNTPKEYKAMNKEAEVLVKIAKGLVAEDNNPWGHWGGTIVKETEENIRRIKKTLSQTGWPEGYVNNMKSNLKKLESNLKGYKSQAKNASSSKQAAPRPSMKDLKDVIANWGRLSSDAKKAFSECDNFRWQGNDDLYLYNGSQLVASCDAAVLAEGPSAAFHSISKIAIKSFWVRVRGTKVNINLM